MTSIGLRPAGLFLSLTGVNTAASISARKLSNGTTRAIISSGSPFAVIAASRLSASKNPNCPIPPTPRILLPFLRFAQIRGSPYFSRCPYDNFHGIGRLAHRRSRMLRPKRWTFALPFLLAGGSAAQPDRPVFRLGLSLWRRPKKREWRL